MYRRLLLLLAAISCTTLRTMAQHPMQEARGTFEVQMNPQDEIVQGENVRLGKLQVEKTFSGQLEGTATGTMLTALTPETGSAGYVLIEWFSGTLNGKAGGFALQHNGLMDRGTQQLSIALVPGSGTGGLAGIRGEMRLDLSGGAHAYTLLYTLPE